jgi:hypothetical protein
MDAFDIVDAKKAPSSKANADLIWNILTVLVLLGTLIVGMIILVIFIRPDCVTHAHHHVADCAAAHLDSGAYRDSERHTNPSPLDDACANGDIIPAANPHA